MPSRPHPFQCRPEIRQQSRPWRLDLRIFSGQRRPKTSAKSPNTNTSSCHCFVWHKVLRFRCQLLPGHVDTAGTAYGSWANVATLNKPIKTIQCRYSKCSNQVHIKKEIVLGPQVLRFEALSLARPKVPCMWRLKERNFRSKTWEIA